MIKKYSVEVIFNNGMKEVIKTNSDVRKLEPIDIDGGKFIFTEEEIGLNLVHIEDIRVTQHR